MRLEIDGGGYETAVDAFATGNQLAAMAHQRLARCLADSAGMAGDDATSADFATAYDQGAREAIGALGDLVDAFAGVGRLTEAALANHLRADARSVVNGSVVYQGESLPETGYLAVLPVVPPSSLGANPFPLPGKVEWILDHVGGFVWPDADLDRVRAAAAAWTAAADGLNDLTTCCDSATRGFWHERSPEIPLALALDATGELRGAICDLASLLSALAAQCATYADDVEEHRRQVLALAEWLLEQIVEGILISIGIGLITGGAGAGAAGGAVLARVVAESRHFEEILLLLRGLTSSLATSTRATRDLLRASRVRLLKFKDAAVVRGAVRSERGSIDFTAFHAKWLRTAERSGGHALARHSGKSDEWLLQRLQRQPHIKRASTFTDETTAERAVTTLIERHADQVENWLRSSRRDLPLEGNMSDITGRVALRDGTVSDVHGLRIYLVRDASMPQGFLIKTAYPVP